MEALEMRMRWKESLWGSLADTGVGEGWWGRTEKPQTKVSRGGKVRGPFRKRGPKSLCF